MTGVQTCALPIYRGGVGRLRGVGGVGRRAERARAAAATLLENADVALELMWEHMWDYD